jgi:ribosomal silencing factor RsfS
MRRQRPFINFITSRSNKLQLADLALVCSRQGERQVTDIAVCKVSDMADKKARKLEALM